jgi:branched-chain amino acid transport system substrate-binding protein
MQARTTVRLLSRAAAVILALAAGTSFAQTAPGRQAAPLSARIGVISILSGAGAAYGEAITNGFRLARDEINAKGKLRIELIVEDSSGKQEQALAAAQKLINSDRVTAILGPTLSTEMRVVGPEADASGVPIMGTSNTAQGIPQIGRYVFRDSIPESQAIPASIGKAVKKYRIKKVALLYGNDDVFTKSGFDTMKEVSQKMNLSIVDEETFQKGQADYKAQLTKIKSLAPDAIFCSALYEEGAVILSQARKMGIRVPIVGGNGFNSPKVIEIAGDAAEGLIVATPWFPEKDDPKVKAFVAKYAKAFGKKPDQFAAQAYDGLYVMADAFQRAGKADRTAVRDALAGIRNFDGVLGRFSFTEDGDVRMDPSVLIVRGGKFQLFQ